MALGRAGGRRSRSGVSLRPIDLTDGDGRDRRPPPQTDLGDVVLHAAALARVVDCCRDPERARHVNTDATQTLAGLAADAGARLVLVSTDLVFDGENAPYRETHAASPASVYGWTKREAEVAVLAVPRSAAVRVSLLYGPSLHGRPSFFDEQVAALRAGRPVTLFRDEWRTPLDLVTAGHAPGGRRGVGFQRLAARWRPRADEPAGDGVAAGGVPRRRPVAPSWRPTGPVRRCMGFPKADGTRDARLVALGGRLFRTSLGPPGKRRKLGSLPAI